MKFASSFLPRRWKGLSRLILWLALGVLGTSPCLGIEGKPLIRFQVSAEDLSRPIRIEGRLEVRPGWIAYLSDFGQLEEIHWFSGNREVTVNSKKIADLIVFDPFTDPPPDRFVYTLKCLDAAPNKRPKCFLIRNDQCLLTDYNILLGLNGLEAQPMHITWQLPDSWRLVSGPDGLQKFADAKDVLFIAGRMEFLHDEMIDGHRFRLAAVQGMYGADAEKYRQSLVSLFRHAWKTFGPLPMKQSLLALFPNAYTGDYANKIFQVASGLTWGGTVHELLHFWSNIKAPLWFSEGAHTYIAEKMAQDFGLIDENAFKFFTAFKVLWLKARLKKDGQLPSLAAMSEVADYSKKDEAVYHLGALFAAKLDREIRSHSPAHDFEKIAALVFMRRHQPVDIIELIKKETGYDPTPVFKQYFWTALTDLNGLL